MGNRTGVVYEASTNEEFYRSDEFLRNHSWIVPRSELEDLKDKYKDSVVFICGFLKPDDLSIVIDQFEKVFAIYIDDKSLAYRLQNRTTGDWGKKPHELAFTLEIHHEIYEKYADMGAVQIDASEPVEKVAGYIISNL